MYKRRQKLDDLVWDQHDAEVEESRKQMPKTSFRLQVQALVRGRCGKSAKLVGAITAGFNFLYKIRFPGEGEPVLLRAPWPSAVRFPGEKTLYEAATLEYLRLNTRVPVPRVLCSARESEVGPMLILNLVENADTLTKLLAKKDRDPDLPPPLNPDLPEGRLRSLWGKMTSILLELAKPSFPRVGSPTPPRTSFTPENKTFAAADEWYLELSHMHLAQLVFQHNDLVTGEDDCRNKYVARQLFRGLARQGRLSTFGFAQDDWSAAAHSSGRRKIPAPDGEGGFRLWCDDFRLTNVLVRDGPDGEVEVAAAIDWEFAYAAPAQFALDPPWWLLVELPEMWLPSGVDEWSRTYEGHLETWLRAVEEQEEKEDADSSSAAGFLGGVPLSAHMRESWETGRFWLNYAARKSWAFDAVF
ncbi:phosphotransferase [Colletotrichum sojae]|uniref:Phosphotransferase n=1 Tax=Colletotrichum sojae TaxID=2175907 RepID=A0A8H6MLT4_9PEZI|nr:phosphotransferase [Colletotrichum sojae]